MEDPMKFTINFKVFGVPDGELLDGNDPDNPLVLEIEGDEQELTELERTVSTMNPGETREIEVDADETVGEWDESRIERIPVSQFAEGTEFEEGMLYAFGDEGHGADEGADEGVDEGEGEVFFRVIGREGDVVVCDFNHPLAGRRLKFVVTLLSAE